MNRHAVEHARGELIQALRSRAASLLSVAEALARAEAPRDVLSALHSLGEVDISSEVGALSGNLGVLALLAQEEQGHKQAL